MIDKVNYIKSIIMPAQAINELLHSLSHNYKTALRTNIKNQHIPLPITHIRALKGIYRNANCTAQSIAQRMQRDKAQITRVLNELLEDGYISKIANPEDRRSQLLRLSAKGKEIVTQLNVIERTANKAMTANLSNEDMHAFIRIANIMVDNLAADSAQ